MKQNKKYLAFIPTVAIIVSILAIPVFADSNPLILPSCPTFTQEAIRQYGLACFIDEYGQSYVAQPTNTNYNYYCFAVDNNFYIASETVEQGYYFYSRGDTYWNYFRTTINDYYSTYGLYYAQYNNVTINSGIPIFASLTDGLNAISNPSSPSTNPYDLDYSLPPGNVAFVELTTDSSDLILTTDMPSLSNLFGEAWSNVSQMYGYSNSLPSSGSSFNTSGLSTIDWSKAAPFNVLGQSKNAAKILSVSTSSNYLVIYNPLYFYVRDGGNGAESSFLDNGYIRIRLNDVRNVKVYSLTSSAQIGPNASTEDAISSTVTSSGVTQTIDTDTGLPIWTDSDGNTVEAPGVGTGNIASSGTTTFSILQQIADTISNFFQGSVGAISNLIDNGSSFMSKLGTLYSWLPPPVYAVLTSALILVITIGVIKVFL